MQRVKENDSVTIVYEGLLASGEKFESSQETGPLQFQLGTGSVLPAFEEAVLGMAVRESRSVTVPAEAAYGKKDENLIMTVPRENFAEQTIKAGMILGMSMEKEGQRHTVPATVVALDKKNVTVDFNHPLAGQEITYQITLLSIDTPEQAATDCDCQDKKGEHGKTDGSGGRA
ncbi:FKBP-type peptidyl-prolyl cis-trans isomerase [Thiovibrio sp. JS02]